MAERADPFANDFDVADFTPQKPKPPPDREAVRKVSEESGFVSREPADPKPARGDVQQKTRRRERRIHRTNRTEKFFCTADPVVIDEFYAITDKEGWVMGQTLENAVAALKRELKGKGA